MQNLVDKVRAFAGTHLGQQIGRFLRVAVVSGVAIWQSSGHTVTWGALGGAAVGGLEAAYRQFQKVTPTDDSADAVTVPPA